MRILCFLIIPIFSFFSAYAQPVNNDCSSAQLLSYTGSCNFSIYSNSGATNSGDATASCGGVPNTDMWFKIIIPSSGNIVINTDGITILFFAAMSLYTGDCSNLTQYVCDDNSSTDYLMPYIEIHDTTIAGDTLYLQVWGNQSKTGNYKLCVFEPTPPVNAVCDSSISLIVQPSCNNAFYTTNHAGHSGMLNPPCGGWFSNDVWFDVVVPSSGKLILNVTNNGISNAAMAVYTGACNTLQTYQCNDNGSQNYLMPRINIDDLTLANQTIYIRVWKVNSIYGGGFGICAFEPIVDDNQNCTNAKFISPTLNCDYKIYSNKYYNTSGLVTPSCGSYLGTDVWFKTIVPLTGKLVISTRNISISNLALSVYTGNCLSLTQLICRQSGSPYYLMPEIIINDTSLAGDTIYIMGWRENSIFGGSFEMCVFELSISANLNCTKAEEIIVQPSCNLSNYSNRYAQTSGDGLSSCGAYVGTDVWFKFIVPNSGVFTVDSSPGSLNNIDFSLYTGSCGGLTEYTCSANGSTSGNSMPKIVISDLALANQTVFLQVWAYNNVVGGTFNLCVYGDLVPEVLLVRDQEICGGDSILPLSVFNGVFQYNWYDQPIGGNLVAKDTSQFLPTIAGTYYVDATNPNTLQASIRVPISLIINGNPIIIGGTDVAYCSSDNILPLSIPNLGVTYNWYDDSLFTNILALDTNQYFTTIAGDYLIIAYDSSTKCSSSKLINLTINTTPILVNPIGFTGCDGSYIGLSVDDLGVQYNWYTDSISGVQIGFNSAVVKPTTNGIYYVQAVDINTNCQSVRYPVSLNLFESTNPFIAFDGDSLHTSIYQNYQWYKNGIAVFQANSNSFFVSDEGNYFVEVFNQNGCVSNSDTVFISFLGEAQYELNDYTVYPNPFNHSLQIRFEEMHLGGVIQLFNVQGILISELIVNNTKSVLMFDDLSSGVYFIKYSKQDKSITKKVIKY